MRILITVILTLACTSLFSQGSLSQVWVADNGNGTYRNPVIHADYSDPDVVRIGEDYFMVSSSFNHIPGLPVLHSKDLVNWKLIGYALKRQSPFEHYDRVQHGNGVWAPSIRYHKGEVYLYYPDPDFGIYLLKAKTPYGPWTDPILVEAGKGLIDPCPLWDEDGKAYLVHAFAGSRAGIKSIIVVKQLSPDGTKVLDEGVMVYDGHELDPTIEGPKFYKRNGWYYIFAPAGGVSTGWQTVLRSRNIYGPYERKVVMDQGSTNINGPHQGGWVTTPTGEHWFLHFQDKEAYGRIVHLQPMVWKNDWPVIGEDKDGDGKGQPVLVFKKPTTSKSINTSTIPDSDEFNTHKLGLQWQWQANPAGYWVFPTGDRLRMFSVLTADSLPNMWSLPSLLMQKFPAEEFQVTTKLRFQPRLEGEQAGLIIHGADYAHISLMKEKEGVVVFAANCLKADKGPMENRTRGEKLLGDEVFLRVKVARGAICSFSYSLDGKEYITLLENFTAKPGRWVGAKLGLYCSRKTKTNDAGYVDIDWFRFEPLTKN
jgi:beta-xylosidase